MRVGTRIPVCEYPLDAHKEGDSRPWLGRMISASVATPHVTYRAACASSSSLTLSWVLSWISTSPVEVGCLLHRDDVDQMLNTHEVVGIAGVEAGAMCVRRRCDQQVHCPRLSLSQNDRGCEPPVARRNVVIDWESIKPPLELRQASKSFGSDGWIIRYEHSKVQFGNGCRADCQFTIQGWPTSGNPRTGCGVRGAVITASG